MCHTPVTFYIFFCFRVGDIESNLGPKKEEIKHLSCCQWNFNSLLAQNTCKISQTEPHNSLYNYDFICISETYFDSSILKGDRNFQLYADLLQHFQQKKK